MGVKLVASSGGSVELVPTNTASNFTVTVPASTTTMVGTDATQTLTNKTLTSPALTTPIASTTIGVGNATPAASGAGITFPATQSASTDANTLDDYEEGTWTPTLYRYSSLPTITYTTQVGTYVKIGKTVIVHCSIQTNTVSANGSGVCFVDGLPFVPNTTALYAYNGPVHYNTIFATANARSVMTYLGKIAFHDSSVNTSEINDNFISAGYLSFTCIYQTDA